MVEEQQLLDFAYSALLQVERLDQPGRSKEKRNIRHEKKKKKK